MRHGTAVLGDHSFYRYGTTNLRLGPIFEEDLAASGAQTASRVFSGMIGHAEVNYSAGGRKPLSAGSITSASNSAVNRIAAHK